MRIILTTENQEKHGSKFVTIQTETKEITQQQYDNIIDPAAIKFFRNLGGIETVQKSYTYAGYVPTRILSTSPNRQLRTIRNFKFILD